MSLAHTHTIGLRETRWQTPNSPAPVPNYFQDCNLNSHWDFPNLPTGSRHQIRIEVNRIWASPKKAHTQPSLSPHHIFGWGRDKCPSQPSLQLLLHLSFNQPVWSWVFMIDLLLAGRLLHTHGYLTGSFGARAPYARLECWMTPLQQQHYFLWLETTFPSTGCSQACKMSQNCVVGVGSKGCGKNTLLQCRHVKCGVLCGYSRLSLQNNPLGLPFITSMYLEAAKWECIEVGHVNLRMTKKKMKVSLHKHVSHTIINQSSKTWSEKNDT